MNTPDQTPTATKTCAKCHTTLPATPDHFYRDIRSTDLLNSYCISCTKEASHESYLRYKTRRDARRKYNKANDPTTPLPEGLKRCNVCKIPKPATRTYFHKHATNKDGYYSTCKQCRNAMIRQSRGNPYQTPESFLKTLAAPKHKRTSIDKKLAIVFPE